MVLVLTIVARGMYLYMFKLYHYLKGVFVGEWIFVEATIVDPEGGTSYSIFYCFDMSLAIMGLLWSYEHIVIFFLKL
jgi:hypothetical protein